MITRSHLLRAAAGSLAAVCLSIPAQAQDTIKIGEINSYKAQPAFLEPYKKGRELAVEEINAAGGVLGKKLEVDHRATTTATPATRCASPRSWSRARRSTCIAGTFLSNVGLAVTDFAKQSKVFFLAAEPLTDKIVWQNGNRYTFRLRAVDLHADGDAGARGGRSSRRSAGRSSIRTTSTASRPRRPSRSMLKKAQPDVEFVAEQAPPLGKIDAGAVVQALADAKPDAIFNVAVRRRPRQVRARGQHARPVQGPRRWSACWPASPSTSTR